MAVASLCIYSCIAVKGEAAETGRYIAEDVLSPEVETEITERIASMSLHEKVCQMIVCYRLNENRIAQLCKTHDICN